MQRRDIIKLTAASAVTFGVLDTLWKSSTAASKKTAQVSIDWTNQIAKSTPFTFGSNDYEILSPERAADRTFQNHIQQLGIKLIRIHHAQLCDRWTDAATKTWNVAKIKAGYDASYPHKPTIIQNLPGWPKWMVQSKDGLLDKSEYDNYATLCAQLVEILNRRLQKKVIYWEPLNEKEVSYDKAWKLDELWIIYNKVAKAMKAVDPQIKIGGPALTWDNPKRLEAFLRACKPNVDFISWHRYGSKDAKQPTDGIMSYTPNYARQVKDFRAIAKKYIPERPVPLLLGEYNINYLWTSGETRQHNHIGAVWFASVMKHLADAGVDMATSWHLKDGIYGMIDPKNQLRPPATIFAWANKYLIGAVMHTTSDHPFVEALAVQKQDGKRSLLLINKSYQSVRLSLQSKRSLTQSKNLQILSLNANGVTTKSVNSAVLKQPLLLSSYSVTLLLNNT
ncbi:alpha-L-arabinofuranosidase [Scytonema hofmannii PCC 7110]|uniref:Alpha-L-arabinofuranosidase n=1 Tax=Scytonema hofmannii PCC 7110 TaxID=128403 RepID=A0A139WSR9_9CYAN|nr:hypothetical protein [Scytonema hofmannii]KYC35478.1 alpha-L-arabinofuranosidase [Scytonema hofmannii PCC 7110]